MATEDDISLIQVARSVEEEMVRSKMPNNSKVTRRILKNMFSCHFLKQTGRKAQPNGTKWFETCGTIGNFP